MRKALVIGIDYYQHVPSLFGCVNDAHAVQAVLERHANGKPNFGVQLMTATGGETALSRPDIKDEVARLFADKHDIALLYFAGHGHVESTGGYLCASDCKRGDDGLALGEVLTMANDSPSQNKIIVLDSCHSGVAGTPAGRQAAEINEGMTILTASTKDQYASEENGSGVFTALFVDAMRGAAANLVGDVTPGSVYAHIDQSLGPWQQRPVFKTNVTRFVSLREVAAPVDLAELQQMTALFPSVGFDFKLDPSFEPEMRGRPDGAPPPDPQNVAKFKILQKYNRVNLVVPVDAPHMWNAAIESKSCKLTALGEHYRRLAELKRI